MTPVKVLLSLGLIWLAVTAGMGCSKSGDGTGPSDRDRNLLANGSFEKNGEPTLEGWTVPVSFNDVEVVNSSAPGGGEYSLELTSYGHQGPAFVTATAGEAQNGVIYRLSAHVRGTKGNHPGGRIGLVVGGTAWPSLENAAWTKDSAWTLLSVTDTAVVEAHDSLKVWLSAFSGPGPIWGAGQFDLVTLERLDP